MSFWPTRILMLIWGFGVVYAFTGRLDLTSKVFIIQALGNTIIMALMKKPYGYKQRHNNI
jgi:uncharacterized membrane protein